MHIVNAMFSKGQGGIEQALADYCEALKLAGHKVTAIISPNAAIKDTLLLLGVNIIEVKNFAAWDFLAKAYIKKIMLQLAPDAVILHGNRAVTLLKKTIAAFSRHIPLIGVTHNYSIKHLIGLDAILATTDDLKQKVIAAGQKAENVIKLPNMVRVTKSECNENITKYRSPIIIGTMGRFVKKKGFEVFINAISDVSKRGVAVKAIIGGAGEEEGNLIKLATDLGLCAGDVAAPAGVDILSFSGWVKNKEQFFADIDIFCLPSLHEPFGIILLEAFANKIPVITTNSEGPAEIAANEIDAIIVQKNDSKAMADAIIRLANDFDLASALAQNGFAKAMRYDIKNFSASLNDAMFAVVNK